MWNSKSKNKSIRTSLSYNIFRVEICHDHNQLSLLNTTKPVDLLWLTELTLHIILVSNIKHFMDQLKAETAECRFRSIFKYPNKRKNILVKLSLKALRIVLLKKEMTVNEW